MEENKKLHHRWEPLKSRPLSQEQKNLVEVLFEKVEDITGYDKKIIVSKKRNSELVTIRMIMGSILRNEAHLTFHNIGLTLIRNHSTIVYYVKQHNESLVYPEYNRLYFNILDRVVHKIKRAKSKLSNLKHKRKLLIWATRRYESSEV